MIIITKFNRTIVLAVQEINSKERDQFWLKEELEERKRVEAERKRREEVRFEFIFMNTFGNAYIWENSMS